MEINELGIYNLEKVVSKKEADAINLAYKNHLHQLTLHWKNSKSSADNLAVDVLESLRPHRNLKNLHIVGHKCGTSPTWLKHINLESVMVEDCKSLSFLPPIPWNPTLCHVEIRCVGSRPMLSYKKGDSQLVINGNGDLMIDEKVLAFNNLTELQCLFIDNCKPLREQHLQKLTSLRDLELTNMNMVEVLRPSSNGCGNAKWKLPVKTLRVAWCNVSREGLIRLLYHFPELSDLDIYQCGNITSIGVMVAKQETTTSMTANLENARLQKNHEIIEIEEAEELQQSLSQKYEQQQEGLMYFPLHLCSSIQNYVSGTT